MSILLYEAWHTWPMLIVVELSRNGNNCTLETDVQMIFVGPVSIAKLDVGTEHCFHWNCPLGVCPCWETNI